MQILANSYQFSYWMKVLAYTHYQVAIKASGIEVVLSNAEQELIFELTEDLTEPAQGELYARLEEYKRDPGQENQPFIPQSFYRVPLWFFPQLAGSAAEGLA